MCVLHREGVGTLRVNQILEEALDGTILDHLPQGTDVKHYMEKEVWGRGSPALTIHSHTVWYLDGKMVAGRGGVLA